MVRAPAGFLDDLLRLVLLVHREFCASRLSLAAGILDRRRKLLNRAPGLGHQLIRSSGLRASKEEPHENTNCDQHDNYRNVMMLNAVHAVLPLRTGPI